MAYRQSQHPSACPCCSPGLMLLSEAFLMPRRMFLLGAGSFAATVALGGKADAESLLSESSQLAQGSRFADAIYINATVITVNDKQPTAEAVAVKGGKILAVGDRRAISALKGPTTQVFDLKGQTMVPGFIDPHGHLFMQGIAATVADLLPPPDGPVDSIPKLQAQLKAWSQTPAAAKLGWIVGNGYEDTQLQEQRHPTREELDAVSTTVPILALHQSGHLATINSKALELAKITADTPDPEGGVIRRQAGSKEPNGVLEESATLLVLDVFSKTAQIKAEDALNLVQQGVKVYIRHGFTTAQEGRSSKVGYDALRAAAATNSLPIDVAVYPDYVTARDAHTWGMSSTYTNHLRLAGIKISTDGSVQGYTAWMSQPFYKQLAGQPADYRGYGALTDAQLIDRVESAYQNNVQAIIHGNGDAAIDQIIMAVRKATEKYGKGERRTVLIHGQTVREDQLDACQQLGIFPALFPSQTFYSGDWYREMPLGPERAARISPTRSVLNRGMKVTIHADAPVILPNAMRIMWSAVNRRTRTGFVLGRDQALTPLEALKAQTIWSAYQHFEEDQKGSIEVGKLADFAILAANPLTVDPMMIKDIEVVETIKEGKSIYKAGSTSVS